MSVFFGIVATGLYALSALSVVGAIQARSTDDPVWVRLDRKDKTPVFERTADRRQFFWVLGALLLAMAVIIGWFGTDPRPTTVPACLSLAIWYIFFVAGGYFGKQAFDGYEHREHAKHSATRKEARVMLYKIIGSAVLMVVLWAAGISFSELLV